LSISQILEQASEVGQSKYLQFCGVLEKVNSLGTVTCQVTLTKGRFRTKVVQERLFENEVENNLETLVPTLRTFVENGIHCIIRIPNCHRLYEEVLEALLEKIKQIYQFSIK